MKEELFLNLSFRDVFLSSDVALITYSLRISGNPCSRDRGLSGDGYGYMSPFDDEEGYVYRLNFHPDGDGGSKPANKHI